MTPLAAFTRHFFAALTGIWLVCLSAAVAQELPELDLGAWQSIATEAEATVDDAKDAPNAELEALRSELVAYREEFNRARTVNATRIASLRDQLALLGEAPAEQADAAPEAAELAAQRTELEEQLATLLAPVQVADAAYTRADGLVSEIDRVLRGRQTEKLLMVVESPLNPGHWQPTLKALETAFLKLFNSATPEQATQRSSELHKKLPVIFLATLGGLVLLLRGRRWSARIVNRLRRAEARGLGIWQFVVSMLRIALPLSGLALLSFAGLTTGFLGERGDELILLIPVLGGIMLGFRWVAEQVFAREEDSALLELYPKERAEARFVVGSITLFLVAERLLILLLELDDAGTAAVTVVSFPFTVLISYLVFRMGRLLRSCGKETIEGEDAELTRASTLGRMVRSLGTGAVVVAVVSPLLQAVGYYNASEALLHPYVLTLVLLGLVLALQRFAADVYGAITGQGTTARETLMPIFLGLVLIALLLPLLALVWGARVADLTEIWAAFRRGFTIGSSRISPTDFLTFALIFTGGYLFTRLAQGALKTNVLPKTKIDKGGQNAIVSGLGYVGIFLAALAAITGAGIDLSSLAIVAGALSVGIGFGLQNIVSNFVAGIILLIERPISEGDWIEVGEDMGYVRSISVRSTRIETFDRSDVIVPNSDLVSGTVTNYTRGNTVGRVIVPVRVAYGTDTRKVEAILQEIATDQPLALTNPAPSVLLMNFGTDSLEFEIRLFLRDVNWMLAVKSDVNHAVVARFAEEGIEIPMSQRNVWLRNPDALQNMSTAPRQTEPEDGHDVTAEQTAQNDLSKGDSET